MMKKILDSLYKKQVLGYQDAREILTKIALGHYNASQIASFMTVFMMRGVTIDELTGFRDALMDLCIPVNLDGRPTIDLCGTGGDEKNTFNISTLASFVVAAAGVPVAKHGNYGVSSVSGSSNVLETLGYKFKNNSDNLQAELDECGICFMHAPLFHPAMKTVAPIRKELGVKTFFNMLGPMVNPSRPPMQMIGVFSLELARMYHYIYQQSAKKYAIVYNLDGYDECSLTNDTRVLTHQKEKLLSTSDFGYQRLDPIQIQGADSVTENARLFLGILKLEGSRAHEEVVIANAALALQTSFDESLTDSLLRATESLRSGKAYQTFKHLISIQQ